jgi:hypothetical protein
MRAAIARSNRRQAWRSAIAAAFACMLAGCGPKEDSGPPVSVSTKADELPPPSGKAAVYEFDSLDERPVSSEAMRGKPTIIVFVSTGDIVGQAQVSYLVHMAKADGDRVNYAMVALHPRKEIVLVEAYSRTLGVEFPVALGDSSATHATGPFGEIPAVPTLVLLDRGGRLVWKHTGLVKHDEIRRHVRGL